MAEFVPANAIEETLLAARDGEVPLSAMFEALFESEAVILLDKAPPETGTWDNSINPLVLDSKAGYPVLALFTSLERATPVAERMAQHKLALQVEVRWILQGVQPHVGLVINPGTPMAVEIPPDGLAELKRDYGI